MREADAAKLDDDDFSNEAIAARRALANHTAMRIIAEIDVNDYVIQDADVFLILEQWGFEKNYRRRSVMQPGQDWVHSDTLGLIRFQNATVSASGPTVSFPYVTLILARWMKQQLPDFPCTSISVNKDYAGKMHRDAFNAGPSVLMALGDFTGGCLEYWPDDDRTVSESRLRITEKPQVLDAKANTVMFDGCRAHAVSPFEGRRYSLVFFTSGSWENGDEATMSKYGMSSFTRPTTERLRALTAHVPPGTGIPSHQGRSPSSGRPMATTNVEGNSKRFRHQY